MSPRDDRFLLRLWCDGREGDAWRATLKDLSSDDTWHFGSLQQLFGHLATLTGVRLHVELHE